MEERSNVVVWEIGRHGPALSTNIAAKIRWADDGTTTLEIPITLHYLEVGGHAVKPGTNVVLLTAEETRFEVSVKPSELPRHIAAMIETSSSR